MAALLACAVLAQAQQLPPGKWWKRPEIVQELQLSAEQQQQLDEVFRAAANDLIDAKGEVEKLQIAIRSELDRKELRKPELLKLAGQLNGARGRLFERELMMLVEMRSVLSEQQWARARNFIDRMQERRDGPDGNRRPMQQGPRRRPQ